MTQDDSERAASDFGDRLKRARTQRDAQKAAKEPKLRSENSGFGQAFRVGAELISALLVGVGIGWALDEWLGTKPWLMIVFIFLGGAAGILNVYRTAMRMVDEEGGSMENPVGSSPDGAEEGREKPPYTPPEEENGRS